jgi:hypothetical protein
VQGLSSRDGAEDEDGAAVDEHIKQGAEKYSNGSLDKVHHTAENGRPLATHRVVQGSARSNEGPTLARRDLQLSQAAPYISAISVVMIGVAVMALLNKMQRGESLKS